MTDTRKRIYDILTLVEQRQLMDALVATRSLVADNLYLAKGESIEDILADYRRLLGYMQSGFVDPRREEVYDNLLTRTYRFLIHYETEWRCANEQLFQEARRQRLLVSHEELRSQLENYVTDVAMMSLDDWSGTDANRLNTVYKEHQRMISRLFYTLLVSRQWNTDDADFYESLLLSPTVDSTDVQIIIAAIMLACINEYDTRKFAALVAVYRQASEDVIRQRALVGWVFSMRKHLSGQEQTMIDTLISDEDVARDLIDLQKQLLFTVSAEKDNEKIQRDIMPTLIKNNQFSITRDGIVEKEEDPMEDLLDPDANDRKMEEVEQMIHQMQQMQQAGSDVYFGGFSQMKRFAFFYDLSNWFTPFYIQHPGIAEVVEKLNSMAVMRNIAENGPFCDSDKYSFTLAISTIINHLPENIKEMMGSAEVMGPTVAPETMRTPTYIRRMYLQDLYRFFRLFPNRHEFENPFEVSSTFLGHCEFFSKWLFVDSPLEPYKDQIVRLLKRQKMAEPAMHLLDSYSENHRSVQYYLWTEQYDSALRLEPNNEKAMRGKARKLYELGIYDEAESAYDDLLLLHPDNATYMLYKAICQIYMEEYEDAIKMLYRLNYEDPDNNQVSRVLAWALLSSHQLEQADKLYQKLTSVEEVYAEDWQNYAYCRWFSGAIDEAIACFKKYMEATGNDAKDWLTFDHVLMEKYAISDPQMRMMEAAVKS